MTARPKIPALLKSFRAAGDALVAELERVYPKDTWIRARCQTNHPVLTVKVVRVSTAEPGRLRVEYGSGFKTSIHCTDVVGPA